MSKQRFLGGLLGANPLRDGSFEDSPSSSSGGGPLRFDNSTYGRIGTDASMGAYNANGITLTNSSTTNVKGFGIDFDAAGFTDSFYVELVCTASNTVLGIVPQNVTAFDISNSTANNPRNASGGIDIELEDLSNGEFQVHRDGMTNPSTSRTLGSSIYNTTAIAYDASTNKVYLGRKQGGNTGAVSWLKGSRLATSQSTPDSWTTALPTSDPTWTMPSGASTLWVQLPPNSSATYYAENWLSASPPSGFDELRLSPYVSGAVSRTTANVGILSLDEAGPEANGSLDITQINWGGIRGRDTVVNGALSNTGILSLNELFVSAIIPDGTILDRAGQYILDRNGNYITTR